MNAPSDHTAYGRAALDRECSDVAATRQGRNDRLNRAGFSLGQIVGAGALDRVEVEARLFEAATACGHVQKHGPAGTRATIASGLGKGEREPRSIPEPTRSNGASRPRPQPQDKRPQEPASPAAKLHDVPIPDWTEPDTQGVPSFTAINLEEPRPLANEIRRHRYRRDGQVVRVKAKIEGGAWRNMYRVRRPGDGAIGWQFRQPAGFVPVPYLGPAGCIDGFDPELAGEPLWFAEGERDVDSLQRVGLVAFTFGSASDVPDCRKLLHGRDVVVVGDNDEAGERGIARKVEVARGVAAQVRVVRFPELPAGGDVSDFIEAGGTVEALLARAEDVVAEVPKEAPAGESLGQERFEDAEPAAPPNPMLLCPKPRIVRPTDLQGLEIPARRWLVRDWMPWGVVTGLYGEGGLGKTLLAQQLQTATALGRSWASLDAAPVRSLGVYCEDSEDELWRRQADIDRLYNCDFEDLDDAVWMPRFGDENLLVRFSNKGAGELTPFHARVIEAAKDHRAELVIVDTVSDTFGGNENDRGQVRAYVSWCLGTIAREIGGSVLCCAHPSRSGITSGDGDGGSTGWSAAFRSRLFLHAPVREAGAKPDHDARVLTRKKANYAARHDAVDMHWREGALVPDPIFGSKFVRGRPCADVFLDLLDSQEQEERSVSDNSRASNYAPRIFGRRPEAEGWREADFATAMEELFAAKKLRMEDYGRKSDARRKIVRQSRGGENG